jgi:O-6-methylguanine DNA methyltransferase
MLKRGALIGTVIDSGDPLADAEAPFRREYSSHDRVTWGVGSFMGLYAFAVEDDAGLVELGIGLKTPSLAEKCAGEAVERYWPNGAASVTRSDTRADTILVHALRGVPCPLHMALTPFQERVLRATCAIPRGEVRTYGSIAAAVGDANASRAVANALHRNPVAVVVPCHRVVPSTGKVGGYACGTEIKARILQAEGVSTSPTNSLVLPAE